MDLKRAQAFAGLFSQNTAGFAKLGPLIEEYAEEIEAVIEEADLDEDESISSAKLTLLRTSLGEIDPDLADALEDELSHGISSDQAQTLAAQLTVSCALADQDRVARVFSELSKAYAKTDSTEIDLTESGDTDLDDAEDEIEAE